MKKPVEEEDKKYVSGTVKGSDVNVSACQGKRRRETRSALLGCWASEATRKVPNVLADTTTLKAYPAGIF